MSSQGVAESSIEVSVRNVGGIDETTVEFSSGVTILSGRNATNRTSFLRAVMAALGSDDVSLKGDAEEGLIELTVNGESYSRTLKRREGSTIIDGEPYLEDSEFADLFAFLLESNDARRAVEQGDELYDVLMRPVDTDEIDSKIEALETKGQELDAELKEIESLAQELPTLEEERTQIEADIGAKRSELEEKKDNLDASAGDDGASSTLENQFEELREARNELETIRNNVQDEERIVEALREEQADVKADLDGLAAVDVEEANEFESRIGRHRESIQAIESTVTQLQSVLHFNESLINEQNPTVLKALRESKADTASEGAVTDKLLTEDEDLVCWTCGSRIRPTQIEQTIELLREVHSEKIAQRNELQSEIEELEAERKHVERTKEKRERLRQQLNDANAELEERTERIERLEAEADNLETTVEELEATVENLVTADQEERLALHREINELELELDRLESRLDQIATEIDTIETRLEERNALEEQRTTIDEEIEDLHSRIDRLEMKAVEQFNEQMGTLLDLLEFENLERVWIERIETERREGRRKVTKTVFDLHVVRKTESGSVYEDTVDHLSESEREVVGLVFALSGYLVHDVHDRVPFMLLDSVEALDSERVSTLIDFLAGKVNNLVVALLPEDATAVDGGYQRITEL